MAWTELIDVMRRAAADAALAEHLYRDRSFRSDLREGRDDALRAFSVTTLPSVSARERRQMPASWRLRLDPARARPIL